jgi:pimeloyl-ACP methyl ester carboxylesterase
MLGALPARRAARVRRMRSEVSLARTMRQIRLALVCISIFLGACASTSRPLLEAENAALASDGVSLRFRVAGSDKPDPTIVLVHGFGGDTTIWDEQIKHLSQEHRVVALDLAGHGKSGDDRMTGWTMEAFGDDVRSVCDEIGAEKVILVGHSMGGPAILEAAHLMPDRVVMLVAVETFHDVERTKSVEEVEQILAPWKSDYPTAVADLVRKHLFTPDADPAIVERVTTQMQAMRPELAYEMISQMMWYDAGKRMEGLGVPIRCVNSSAIQATNVQAAKRHAKDFELKTMAGVGHFPMLEAPEEFDELLDETIEGD